MNDKRPFLGFYGTRPATIDGKGRVTFPASLREQAPEGERERFILVCYPEHRLALYREADWLELTNRVSNLAQTSERWNADEEEFLFASAEPVQVDGMGRILVPDDHRRWASLEKAVVFTGARNRVLIWAEERWAVKKERLSEGFHVRGKDLMR